MKGFKFQAWKSCHLPQPYLTWEFGCTKECPIADCFLYSPYLSEPVPKFKKGLGPSLPIVQIICIILRNESHHQKDCMKMSKFTTFGYVTLHSNQAVSCQRLPKFHTTERWRPPNPYKVSHFSDIWKPSTWLQYNETTPNLVNWLILMWPFLWWAPIFN